MTTVIKVEGISKTFKIHHERHQSLKERMLHPRSGTVETFNALKDISFSVDTNETVGLVGHNGSGKSTLLKCICGVLQPTSGQIHLRGSLAALLELGAGFQPELSGRDNIFLYGAMLGFSKKMVEGIFDDVVDFSEIENFIDTQVKFYSSGMYVRLAFAVAVNVDPDILVVDEVLAVGDERFQAKCIDRIRTFQDEGRSILFVTHNADQVRAICDRAIVLDGGHMIADGPTHESLRIFANTSWTVPSSMIAVACSRRSALTRSPRRRVPSTSEAAPACTSMSISRPRAPTAGTSSWRSSLAKVCLISRSDAKGSPVNLTPGQNRVGIDLAQIPLLDGIYDVNIGIVDPRGNTVIAWREQAASIQVTYDGREGGLVELGAAIRQQ
jgi:ABC-2 type transport system ATP-binding protein